MVKPIVKTDPRVQVVIRDPSGKHPSKSLMVYKTTPAKLLQKIRGYLEKQTK